MKTNPVKFQKKQKKTPFSVSSRETLLLTGTAIHQHLDRYLKVYVPAVNNRDRMALRLFNLITKLEDLGNWGQVSELEIIVPWEDVVGQKLNLLLVGIADVVSLKNNKTLVVEEIKTHDRVSILGEPATSASSLLASRYQVTLYAYMLRAFIVALKSDSKELRRCCIQNNKGRLSAPVLKAIRPFKSIEGLYCQLRHIVQKVFTNAKLPIVAQVIHIPQTLAKRAINLGEESVIAYIDICTSIWPRLLRRLRKQKMWTTYCRALAS